MKLKSLLPARRMKKSSAELHFELIEQQKQKLFRCGFKVPCNPDQNKWMEKRKHSTYCLHVREWEKRAFALDDAFAAARRGELVALFLLKWEHWNYTNEWFQMVEIPL